MPKVSQLVAFFNTVRGTDKTFMFVQYFAKILVFFLGKSDLSQRILNLSGPVSDFRILLRYYGLLQMVEWISYSETNKSKSVYVQSLIRLQNACNVIYYPLEHFYWLAAHQVIPVSPETRDKVGMWSCRFWAGYVVLYFFQLLQEYRDLQAKALSLTNSTAQVTKKDDGSLAKALAQLKEDKHSLITNALINAAYLPLTIHWSLPSSPFPDIGVGICGTAAAILQIKTAWKAVVS